MKRGLNDPILTEQTTGSNTSYSKGKSMFRKEIEGAKKMIDAGKSEEEVIRKYGQAALNAVNAEATLDEQENPTSSKYLSWIINTQPYKNNIQFVELMKSLNLSNEEYGTIWRAIDPKIKR